MDESAAEELDPPAIERLEQVACPTLVLPADHDPVFSQRESQIMADRIPGAQTVAISDVDHVINMRAPGRSTTPCCRSYPRSEDRSVAFPAVAAP